MSITEVVDYIIEYAFTAEYMQVSNSDNYFRSSIPLPDNSQRSVCFHSRICRLLMPIIFPIFNPPDNATIGGIRGTPASVAPLPGILRDLGDEDAAGGSQRLRFPGGLNI